MIWPVVRAKCNPIAPIPTEAEIQASGRSPQYGGREATNEVATRFALVAIFICGTRRRVRHLSQVSQGELFYRLPFRKQKGRLRDARPIHRRRLWHVVRSGRQSSLKSLCRARPRTFSGIMLSWATKRMRSRSPSRRATRKCRGLATFATPFGTFSRLSARS